MRAAEQVRMNLGYMNLNVKAVGIGSGLSMGFLGNSHYGLEDAGVIRCIPGITIVTPADCSEIVKTVFAAAEHTGPMYIRLTGGPNNPIVYSAEYEFRIGKAVTLREGSDVTIIACGMMVYESLEAAKLLEVKGVSTRVINMHTLKPLDQDVLQNAFRTSKLIVTVEEHSVVGGLGSAVAEFKAGLSRVPPQLILGLPDEFGKTGEHRYLLEKYGLVAVGIAEKILARLRQDAD
jgi:transketolase